MASTAYSALRQQLAKLRQTLLPRKLDGIVEVTERLSARALAFRVLCYAEIEEYLESRSQEISAAISTRWKDDRKVTYPTMCVLAFSSQEMKIPPESFAKPAKRQVDWNDVVKIDGRVSRAISEYHYYVTKQNHGVSEENLCRMLIPIGFDIDILDEAALLEFNNFASLRGEAAHKSTKGQLKKGVNPKDENEAVQRMLKNLLVMDDEFTRLLKAANA